MSTSLLAMRSPPVAERFVPAAAAPSHDIHIRLLGGLRILIGDEDVTSKLKYRKGAALLALLAVECDVVHTRDQVCDLFWPDLSLTAARSNLRQVLSNLNKLFRVLGPQGESTLLINAGGVGLFTHPHLHIDVVGLATACAMLHDKQRHDPAQLRMVLPFLQIESLPSELLAGLEIPDCEAFTAWLDAERRYCADRVLSMFEDLAQRAVDLGNLELAIDYARQIERIDPLLEPNQIRLMRLLASSGRPQRALQQFDIFAHRLHDELDVEPQADTRMLRDQIAARTSAPLPTADHDGETSRAPGPYAVSVLYVAFSIADAQSEERVTLLRHAHKAISHVLGQHGAHVMTSPRMGVFAWFMSPDPHTACGDMAMHAARAIIDSASKACDLRIGLYTGTMDIEPGDELPVGLDEGAELAARLSLIADAGDIVACSATVQADTDEAEPLGEWKFRGITQALDVLRIRPRACDSHPLCPLNATRS